MSSVLARYRNISEMEFYENMNKIQKEFYDLLMGKSTPKKCKYTHVLPTMTAIEEALDCMVKANNAYTVMIATIIKVVFDITKKH